MRTSCYQRLRRKLKRLVAKVSPAQRGQERLREAAKLGMSMDMRHALRHVECLANPSRMQATRWEHAIVPKANKPKQKIDGLTVFAVVMAALLIGDSPLSLLLNGFAVVVHTTTPWPRPTPAGVATASRGVSPPLQRERSGSGKGVAQRRSAQTQRSAERKTGETPCGRERAEPLRKGFCCCFSARVGVADRRQVR